jgi:hypothetical protein
MGESRPSEEAIALFTNVFGYSPDPEALHAGECWQAERIDAALRRAKAEGLRLAVQEHRCWEDVLRTEYRNVPTFEAWIDARAAQIEEGE